MLVRILSNIASFLGNDRHRAILVSCLVLVFATSSVVGVLAVHEHNSKTAATASSDSQERDQEETIWLNEPQVDSKDTLEEESSADTKPQADPKSTEVAETENTQSSEATIQLSSSDITLAADKLSDEINAGVTGDASETTWELTVSSPAPDIKIINSKTADKIFTFQLQAGDSVKPGNYQVTVLATNQNGQKISTVLSVIVPETEDNVL